MAIEPIAGSRRALGEIHGGFSRCSALRFSARLVHQTTDPGVLHFGKPLVF